MAKDLRHILSLIRLKLGNPYAFIEYLEEINPSARPATADEIRAARARLQNPHAYIGGDGRYNAVVPCAGEDKRHVKSTSAIGKSPDRIEVRATKLLRRLWERAQASGDRESVDPVSVIDPAKALQYLGYDFSMEEELGIYFAGGGSAEIAGLIDSASKRVVVSKRFPRNVQRFTAAHELGHAVLHNVSGAMHRDRPLSGESLSRDPVERDADKFAAYFLMPRKLVVARFRETFGMERFTLNEETAFGLSCTSLHEIRQKCKSLRDVSKLLADATSYYGRHFPSLAEQFGVSVTTMAIRLEELELIEPIT